MLKRFKNEQLDNVNGQDTSLAGYKLYRKSAGTNDTFVEVSNNIIQWQFSDTLLTNNVEYTYGLLKVYNNNTTGSAYVDKIDIMPSKTLADQQVIIGNSGVFISSDATVTVFTDYVLYFNRSELLNNIIDIDTVQDKLEPRKYSVLVKVEDMAGNEISIVAQRLNASTLNPI
jgi:hypothetical protein